MTAGDRFFLAFQRTSRYQEMAGLSKACHAAWQGRQFIMHRVQVWMGKAKVILVL
jgi:hypothetical protein